MSFRVYPLSFLAFVATCHAFGFMANPSTCDGATPPDNAGVTSSMASSTSAAPTAATPTRGLAVPIIAPTSCGSVKEPLKHAFRRHVRPKKRHEIQLLGEVVAQLAETTGCRRVLDIGSGQGHLARYLAFHYGLNVVTIEAVGTHAHVAARYDREVEKDMVKFRQSVEGQLRHVTGVVGANSTVSDLVKMASPVSEGDKFVVVGLHTCGDLAPTILRLFAQSPEVVAVASVGCCYMKLTDLAINPKCGGKLPGNETASFYSGEAQPNEEIPRGYPMSRFMQTECCLKLSYEARELACHSVESIKAKLKGGSNHLEKFKVHCHRAAVEIILRTKYGLRRSQVRITKRVSKLPFKMYSQKLLDFVHQSGGSADSCSSATIGLGKMSSMVEEQLCSRSGSEGTHGSCSVGRNGGDCPDLAELECLVELEWRQVVVFFMLRQALAPCVERLLLLDRTFFLLEQGFPHTSIYPLFDAHLSPRNTLILGSKLRIQ